MVFLVGQFIWGSMRKGFTVAEAIHWESPTGAGNLAQELAAKIRTAITNKTLRAGDRLPSSRSLASQLALSRGTVVNALELLTAEGLLKAQTGAGTFISDEAPCVQNINTKKRRAIVEPVHNTPAPKIDDTQTGLIDFRPCRPCVESFPLGIWRRCLSAASASVPSSDYADPQGSLHLRTVIAEYLRRARGLIASPDEIIITNGAVHAMHLIAANYLNDRSKVVMEDPGYPLARQIFELSGATLISCPVDNDGLRIDNIHKNTKFQLVYVTPSHQFPTGARLSLGRRRTIIEWAYQNGALVLEDDYDGEFRYYVPPLSPLATMSYGNVIYCGTFSKTLFPDLRIGFAVAPPEIINTITNYRTITEYAPNSIIQKALALFIADGHYERHIHRMRRIYSMKRKTLAQSLAALSKPVELSGLDSGINGLVKLCKPLRANTLSKHAIKNGVLAPTLSQYTASNKNRAEALVLGYGALSHNEITKGVNLLFR